MDSERHNLILKSLPKLNGKMWTLKIREGMLLLPELFNAIGIPFKEPRDPFKLAVSSKIFVSLNLLFEFS